MSLNRWRQLYLNFNNRMYKLNQAKDALQLKWKLVDLTEGRSY